MSKKAKAKVRNYKIEWNYHLLSTTIVKLWRKSWTFCTRLRPNHRHLRRKKVLCDRLVQAAKKWGSKFFLSQRVKPSKNRFKRSTDAQTKNTLWPQPGWKPLTSKNKSILLTTTPRGVTLELSSTADGATTAQHNDSMTALCQILEMSTINWHNL